MPPLVTVSDYAPEVIACYNKHLVIGAAFAMILVYIQLLGPKTVTVRLLICVHNFVGLDTLLKQCLAGLMPLEPLQGVNIPEILQNLSSRRSHRSLTFGNESSDGDATLDSGIFISRVGVMTVEEIAQVLNITNSHTDSQGDSLAIGNAVCVRHDGTVFL